MRTKKQAYLPVMRLPQNEKIWKTDGTATVSLPCLREDLSKQATAITETACSLERIRLATPDAR